jgi:hypothetical protein
VIGRPTKAFAAALVVAAIGCAGAAAGTPTYLLSLHARLAPAGGTAAAGQFSGTLVLGSSEVNKLGPTGTVLLWKLILRTNPRPRSASLRLPALNGKPPVTRMLCIRCSTTAHGRITLTAAQGVRLASPGAAVVVQTASATLRGPVKVVSRVVATTVR